LTKAAAPLAGRGSDVYTSPRLSGQRFEQEPQMHEILDFISRLVSLYIYIIVAGAVLSWLIAFNVLNPYNQFVRSIWQAINAVTEPLLRPIRRYMPDLGGIDISPVVLIIGCWFVQVLLSILDRRFG
jgi:YggT family protein